MAKVVADKTMKTDVKPTLLEPVIDKDEYEQLCSFVNNIAQPLANRKLAKKLYKLVRKASKEKGHLRQGVHDVHKALRREEKGLIILAGNVTPVDVFCHVPALCEDNDIPYIFTPSKEHLGLAAGHRRPAVLLLIRSDQSYQALFDECIETSRKLPINID